MTTSTAPLPLGPNQPDRPYRGGAGIAAFRKVPQPSEYSPEDFVGSTTEIFAGGGIGLSRLPSGELLRDAIASDPEGWLGAAHVTRFGTSTELLVKLLDTGERLFVHLHPDVAFAREHLSLGHGKTEAWIVLAVRPEGEDGYARLGFTRDVSSDEVAAWVDGQHADEMMGAMHSVPLRPGSTILVPAGMPHAIGPGITLLELQEPSDLSILLEYEGYRGLSAADAFLGLDRDVALSSLERTATDPARLEALTSSRRPGEDGITPLLPEEADRFFRAERIAPSPQTDLDAGFSILVVIDGTGRLDWSDGTLEIARGQTLVIPFGAGALRLAGTVTAIRCRPPAVAPEPPIQ
jgi:mannose-6-phosphate isomerase